ncbi:long-chain-fatty-acid--CoA ligase [Chelativorans sp. ZYF759]|uniref:long-chain-fatty-acid--CoA ligase n=1 Tax=Chelativorans sp. ZYF759 TaxID=2692213 RepID=UPI00145C62BE|nr:long-chain-fatty-acid--CoA ligase [Chelativorans sp. ZYF759]NMG41663.1 long-chain-fatty-acid--CoA ligase [Chelativorans sp. ZYF759]
METIYDTLFDNPAILPSRECLAFKNRRFSFADVRGRATRLANALTALGVVKGDRVVVLLHNCNEFVEAFYAITSIGALIVPLNWRLHPNEHIALMKDCLPKAIISEREFIDLLARATREIGSLDTVITTSLPKGGANLNYEELVSSASEAPLSRAVVGSNEASIIYTSGTTGLPKGAVLTHANYLADHDNVGSFAELDAGSVNLQTSPLYHAASMHTFMHVTFGGRTVMTPKFEADEALSLIEREKVTYMFGVPTVIYALLDHPDIGKFDLGSLKTFSYGAAPMSEARFQEAVRVFGYIFIHAYGMTESSSHCSLLGKEEHKYLTGSVGRGLKHSQVKIVDSAGKDAPAGEIGEMVISGAQVMSRYWNRPDATAEALIDGWLHSGDLGMADAEGFLYVKDRKRDMIISGGVNLYPREMEEVIAGHPAVAEVAVYGVPDEKWGEAIAASVVLRSGRSASAEEIREFVGGHLARFKIPRVVTFAGELPKNPSGKVLKRVLQENYQLSRT